LVARRVTAEELQSALRHPLSESEREEILSRTLEKRLPTGA
jgi:hypothetical protein